MTRVGIVTQARTTSTRLPRKVMLRIGDRTVLDHHLRRLLVAGLPIFVTTTTNRTDDEIVALAEKMGLPSFRGRESDVLSRFHGCAVENALDVVVRVTSDCPLIDGEVVASAVAQFLEADDPMLYLSNTLQRTFPRGFDFEVFSAAALAEANENATEPAQREHVTPYLRTNASGVMHLRNVAWRTDKSGYRVTLDTTADLELIRRLIEDFGAHRMSCAQIIALLDNHPAVASINSHVRQKTAN